MKSFSVTIAICAGLAFCEISATAEAGGCLNPGCTDAHYGDASCSEECETRGLSACRSFWRQWCNAGKNFNPRGYGFEVHMAKPCGCSHVYRSGARYPRYLPGMIVPETGLGYDDLPPAGEYGAPVLEEAAPVPGPGSPEFPAPPRTR